MLNVDSVWLGRLVQDEGLNDSDKSFSVPLREDWRVGSIWVEMTTASAAGSRQVAVEVQDSASDVVLRIPAGKTVAASTSENYAFGPGLVKDTSATDSVVLVPFPQDLLVPGGFTIRVFDTAAVAASADDMIVQMLYAVRDRQR